MRRNFEEQSGEIRANEVLSARERRDELLNIEEQYQKERRRLEAASERARSRAWRDFTKQVLADFGRILFQQAQLNIAQRITNSLFDRIPFLSGGGTGGPGAAGSGLLSGTAAGTAATVGVTAVSAAVLINGLIDPVKDLLNSFGFHNASNDQYAFEEARKAGQALFGGQSASQYGRQSARDLVDNVTAGLAASGGGPGATVVNNITMKVGSREIQEVFSTAVGLDTENRLARPGGSRVEREVNAQKVINIEVDTERAQLTADSAVTRARTAQQGVDENRAAITRLAEDTANSINIRKPF